VVDCADPARDDRIQQVNSVLASIGAGGLPVIHVYNKADILGIEPRLDRAETGLPGRVWMSAQTGAGLDLLLEAIAEYLFQDKVRGIVRLNVLQARLRALLYESGQVFAETLLADGGWDLDVELGRSDFARLQSREDLQFYKDLGHATPAATNF
jgi:GTP-binding protein HflX